MNNFITYLLNLKDAHKLNSEIIPSPPSELVIRLEYPPEAKFCPVCGFRMHSKGVYIRTVNHQILQDGRKLVLKLHQHKWKCQNTECGHLVSDSFPFVGKNRRVTNAIDFLIFDSFRDFNLSASQIAARFNVSDTYAIRVFDRYVDLPRLKLTSALCIDEVDLSIGRYKYALVIQDFFTGEPVDMVISRRNEITEPYFADIPKKERFSVQYIISDMYAPYQNYVDKYFPNAIPVVDEFHVVKLINQKLRNYLNALKRKYKNRDIERFNEKYKNSDKKPVLRESREVYILRKKQWLILANQDNIDYSAPPFRDWKFGNRPMYVSDYEQALFSLDPNLEKLRDLKEKYIRFNRSHADRPDEARSALDALISEYKSSGYTIFEEVAKALSTYKQVVINSFTVIERTDSKGHTIRSRLSNGPMESLNRVPKDMKRHARGYSNFEHIRNRFLFAMRKNAPILASPKSYEQVRQPAGSKRGSYNRNKDKGGTDNER